MATIVKCPLKPITKSGESGIDTVAVLDFGPCDPTCAFAMMSGVRVVNGEKEGIYKCSISSIAEFMRNIERRMRH